MSLTPQQIAIIKNCQKSVVYFLTHFGKVKHPSAGILDFKPFGYQVKALKAFRQYRYNIFKKCRQCFDGDSIVWGPAGPKRIEDVKPGDQVYSLCQKTGLTKVSTVLERYDNGERECVNIHTHGGHKSVATLDHHYFTPDGQRKASDLKVGDRVTCLDDPARHGIKSDDAIPLGYLYKNVKIEDDKVIYYNSSAKCIHELQKCLEGIIGTRGKLNVIGHEKREGYTLTLSGQDVIDYITNIGATDNLLPEVVFSWDEETLCNLLSRMLSSSSWYEDGKPGNSRFRIDSYIGAHQIRQLFNRIGIDAEVEASNEVYNVELIGKASFDVFNKKIRIYGYNKQLIIKDMSEDDRAAVRNVTEVGKRKVYDLRVPPYDNYVIDGVVVHNSGISKISGAFGLWFGMFNPYKTILIVSKTDIDAMNFLAENVLFLFDNLPGWMKKVWDPIKRNEHEIEFSNGTKIRSLTSAPDVLRSNASSLNIIDEAAFITHMSAIWTGAFSCITADSIVSTCDGLFELGDLGDKSGQKWQDLGVKVASDGGFVTADKFYINGVEDTIRYTTKLGFQLEGTGKHRVRIINDLGDYVWSRLDELKIGDTVVSLPNTFNGCRRTLPCGLELTPELAEIIGLYVGYGNLRLNTPKRLRICFYKQDEDGCRLAVDKLNSILPTIGIAQRAYVEYGKTTVNLRLNSAAFSKFMHDNGLVVKTNAFDACVPKIILRSDEAVICAFLRGLFDSDGLNCKSDHVHCIGFSSHSEKLASQVQTILHALGIISKRSMAKPGTGCLLHHSSHRVEITTLYYKAAFYDRIGSSLSRKSVKPVGECSYADETLIKHKAMVYEFADEIIKKMVGAGTFRQCEDKRKWNLHRIRRLGRISIGQAKELINEFESNSRLSKYLKSGFHFDTIAKLTAGRAETYDLSVPHNNTYIANGQISHNTLQHGGNVIVVSTCVNPETYIFTSDGLQQIKDLDRNNQLGFSPYEGPEILTRNGLKKPHEFYKRQIDDTKVIRTKNDYKLECTHKHRIWTYDGSTFGWTYADEVKPGHAVSVIRGQNIFGDDDRIDFKGGPSKDHPSKLYIDVIDEELAYMIGVMTAGGTISETYATVTNGDVAVIDAFLNNSKGIKWSQERRSTHIRCYDTRFVRFWKSIGFKRGRAWDKVIPHRLLKCSKPVLSAYLRGLFDGNGFSRTRNGEAGLVSTSEKLIEQVQLLLLNYGIVSGKTYKKPSTRHFKLNGRDYISKCRESWVLTIGQGQANKFYEQIGFGLTRKQVKSKAELIPGIKELIRKMRDKHTFLSRTRMIKDGFHAVWAKDGWISRDLLDKFKRAYGARLCEDTDYLTILEASDTKYYWDEVKSIEDNRSETMDFNIPADRTYWSNGFLSHNTNGVGNWYWSTYTDAEAGLNQFNPIIINWWDMDWTIDYTDPLSGEYRKIAPTDGLRPCVTPSEIQRYGKYWSPWLEEQYKGLQEKGEPWRFKQEVLADFVGGGNTVVPEAALIKAGEWVHEHGDKFDLIDGIQTYVHPVTNDREDLDFTPMEPTEGLWIWQKPVTATPDKVKNGEVIEKGRRAHSYVMGVDLASGKGKDYHAIEVIDVDTMEQVAEMMIHCLPMTLKKYIDRIGRWYNCALCVIERNFGGDAITDELRLDYMYPRLWRRKTIDDRPSSGNGNKVRYDVYGFMTSQNSKPLLNKLLMDSIRDDGEGLKIYSKRLLKQLSIYVRKKDRSGRDTYKTEAEDGPGNHDDLVIALALALVGVEDAYPTDAASLIPVQNKSGDMALKNDVRQKYSELIEMGGPTLLVPVAMAGDDNPDLSAMKQLQDFTMQIGGISIASENVPMTSPKKHEFKR